MPTPSPAITCLSTTSQGCIPPLTTVFTTPGNCQTQLYSFYIGSTFLSWNLDVNDRQGFSSCSSINGDACGNFPASCRRRVNCQPDGHDDLCLEQSTGPVSLPDTNRVYTSWASFSPGACPSGYTMYTTSRLTSRTDTIGYCCPSSFTYNGGWDCASYFATATTAVGYQISQTASYSNTTSLVGTVTLPAGTKYTAVKQAYMVLWQSSDLQSFTPASLPLLQLSARDSALGVTPPPTSQKTSAAKILATSSSPLPVAPKKGLSEGGQIGVGVGVGIAIIIFVGLAVGFLLRRKINFRSSRREEIK